MVNKIKREIQILKLFHHPHIIKLYQVITSPTDIFMMMEYVSGGELFDYILEHGKLEEADARKFFQQIISGVDYCHRHMVVHRDLKPENLLLDAENNVKIADFGLSNIMTDGDFLKTSCGSPNYASPEVISGMLYAGPEVDVWSCGVILYVLLCGKLPFDEDYVPHLFKKIKDGVYEMPAALSADAKDVLSGMLRVDSLARLTIPQIREHPWFVIDLADYLFPGPDNDEPEATQFDEAAIAEVCQKFQVYREHVLDVLRESKSDTKNQINIAYRLILTNRKLAASGHTLGPEEVEVSDGSFLNRPRRESSKARGLLPERGLLGPKAAPTIHVQPAAAGPATPGTGAVDAEVSTGPAGKSLPRSKWHLGMRSQNEPHEVMVEVYRAMLALNFQWKVITPYHARCRCWNQVRQCAGCRLRVCPCVSWHAACCVPCPRCGPFLCRPVRLGRSLPMGITSWFCGVSRLTVARPWVRFAAPRAFAFRAACAAAGERDDDEDEPPALPRERAQLSPGPPCPADAPERRPQGPGTRQRPHANPRPRPRPRRLRVV